MPATPTTPAPTARQLAKVIDNQGRIDIIVRKVVITPMLLVKSTNYGLIEWLLRFGGSERAKNKLPDNVLLSDEFKKAIRQWIWRSYNDEAVQITRAIRPHLTDDLKQRQADLILKLKANVYGERRLVDNLNIVEEMLQLHWPHTPR